MDSALSPPAVPDEVSLALRGWAMAGLFLAGATIGLVSLLLPHPRDAHMAALWSNVGIAYAGGIVLTLVARRIRAWMLHLALIAGAVLITRAILLSGDPVSFYAVWYVWVALYAFYFFRRAAAVGYVLFAAALYAATLFNNPPSSPLARWLTTLTTLVVAGVFIDTLVHRARRDARRASDYAQRMAELSGVALELAALSDPVAARRGLRRAGLTLTGARGVVLWERDRDGRQLLAAGEHGSPPQVLRLTGEDDAREGAVRAYRAAQPVWGQRALWQPIGLGSDCRGVLAFRWDDATVPEDEAIRSMCELIAVQAKVTLDRVALLDRLEQVARTDELTGLPNRRAWDEALPRELRKAERSGQPVCVAVLDLDHFKEFNDSFGHQSGDALLRELAAGWIEEIRPQDMLARYGGEEFAVVLPGCSLGLALAVVDRLRTVVPEGQGCSAGVALWDGVETPEQLLDRADRALYEAKRTGRRRSVLAA